MEKETARVKELEDIHRTVTEKIEKLDYHSKRWNGERKDILEIIEKYQEVAKIIKDMLALPKTPVGHDKIAN